MPATGDPPPGVQYDPRAFTEEFCALLDAARDDTPVSLASQNMLANRRFLRSETLARRIVDAMPAAARVTTVCSDLRFIDYDVAGGFILPHTDGTRVDDATGRVTNCSMLLYLTTIPEDEGGETDFLSDVKDEDSVVFSVRPERGSLLLFPHDVPHVGRAVSASYPKILLRGDVVVAASKDD